MADVKARALFEKLGLKHLTRQFYSENITDYSIPKLALKHFKSLGIEDHGTIMNSRLTYCIFGGTKA